MTDHTTAELKVEHGLFVSYCLKNGLAKDDLKRNAASGYITTHIDDMWDGWIARAAISEPALPMAPLTGPGVLLISRVFAQFCKDACLPGDDRISESFIKAAGKLMGARAKPVAWLIRWPNGNEEVFMDLKIAVQQAAMFKTKPIPLGVIAAQSPPVTRAVPVQKLVISKGDRNGNYQEYSVNGHAGMIRVVARMVDEDEDLPLGNRVETFLLAAPTPDAERHVANHAVDLSDG